MTNLVTLHLTQVVVWVAADFIVAALIWEILVTFLVCLVLAEVAMPEEVVQDEEMIFMSICRFHFQSLYLEEQKKFLYQ
jgi:hypothetical protein